MPLSRLGLFVLIPVLGGLSGCVGHPLRDTPACAQRQEDSSDKAKTLLAWTLGPKKEDEKKNGKNGDTGAPERDKIATNRPDFTEASVSVGKGLVQLEAGYTFVRDNNAGSHVTVHSYPEVQLRYGVTDWFELVVGQNFGSLHDHGSAISVHGGQDLYLGARFDLTEQAGIFPESSLVLQTTVPSGRRSFTAGQMLPGFNLCYGWDIIEDKFTLGASTQLNRRIDDDSHYHMEFAQSFTFGVIYTKRFAQFTEWFTLVPSGASASTTRTEHYLDGGFTYLITDNFQLDIRAGVGLNRAADDFFAGTGFAVRY